MPFVRVDDATTWLSEAYGCRVSPAAVDALASLSLLPRFLVDDEPHFLISDLEEMRMALEALSVSGAIEYGPRTLFDVGLPRRLHLSSSTLLDIPSSLEDCTLAFSAAGRHLLDAVADANVVSGDITIVPYMGKSSLRTSDSAIAEFATTQVAEIERSTMVRSSQFASSASYMGSKRSLSGFLVGAIRKHMSPATSVLDLMCGSGAAAAAFARNWDTLASDAQHFAHILAVIQGGGYSRSRADRVLGSLLPRAREHTLEMRELVEDFLAREDHVFHGDIGGEALAEYKAFIESFPTYPHGTPHLKWDPSEEVSTRKVNHFRRPFCLFTAYFANIYFGLRQCVEIDSLRFAITTLDNPEDRTWALGALIATVSCLGTTYGGHFAQPIIRASSDITATNIGRIVEQRAASVLHEFTIRLESLAKESEVVARHIQIIPGPWQNALQTVAARHLKEVLVYLDAPYKRDEYSRYYHVLETLVHYNYPSATRVGRVPDKGAGERFSSEFFSRTRKKIEDTFVEIIDSVLQRKWKCAWSYSDNGDARVDRICDRIAQVHKCKIASYSVPYEHKAIGGPSSKKVIEYLIVFEPVN